MICRDRQHAHFDSIRHTPFREEEYGCENANNSTANGEEAEGYDVVFAIDSIPAIFAITREPFIIFTSNIFAILGLRTLCFVMAAMIAKFRYLKISLSVILAYVGLKLLAQEAIRYFQIEDLMNWVSPAVIIAIMVIGVLASVWANRRKGNRQPNA